MKLKATLLLVTLVAALALVSGRRFHSSRPGNDDRRSIRVKTVVSWICKILTKLQVNNTETLCKHSHPPPFPYTTWPPYPSTWSSYPTTLRPYRTTRGPWNHYRTTRGPWNHYRTTMGPWNHYRTTMGPWNHYRTTRGPWNHFRTTRRPYSSTWSSYRTSWRSDGTTWYQESTTSPFVTGWPRTTWPGTSQMPFNGVHWGIPGRSLVSRSETLQKVAELTKRFDNKDNVRQNYDELYAKLGPNRSDLCGDLALLVHGEFQGRQRLLEDKFVAAVAYYFQDACMEQEKPTPQVHEVVEPVAPVPNALCGQSLKLRKLTKASRIVGGNNTGSCDVIPWQVRVKSQMGLCGGSIISSRHILTAAHCVNEITSVREVSVVVGDYNTKQTENTERTHTVRNVTFHEQFNINSYENDVALLTLNQPVDLNNPCVQAVCRNSSFVPNNMFCTVSGWGTTSSGGNTSETLQMVQVLTFKGSECKTEFSIPKNYPDYVTSKDKQLCAGKVGGGQDSCQGDSGGPLVCFHPESQTFVQVGIVSYGIGCAVKGFPGVYSSVAAFNDWIEAAMAKTAP